jgi:hypothetical protein
VLQVTLSINRKFYFKITVTNLTNDVLFLHTFRGREYDGGVIVGKDDRPVLQRKQMENNSPSPGREGAAMVLKPNSKTKEVISLTRLYDLVSGNYSVYVVEKDPITKVLVRSNTLSINIP